MYVGKPLFAQVMDFLPWKTFHRIVDRHGGDHRVSWLTDVNPAGNWLWQEQQSGLGIAQGIASALCQKKHVSSFD